MDEVISNFFNVKVIIASRHSLLLGLGTTLRIVGLALSLAMGFGLVLSVIRGANCRITNVLVFLYIHIFRSCPSIVLLMVLYYALPFVGLKISAFAACVLAISTNGAAYYCEIFRAGIEAIDKGQIGAARALGLSYLQTMRLVVLPQALRVVLPPLTTNSMELIKGSAIAAAVAIPDLLRKAMQAQGTYLNASPIVGALVLYLLILIPLAQLVSHFEKKMRQEMQ